MNIWSGPILDNATTIESVVVAGGRVVVVLAETGQSIVFESKAELRAAIRAARLRAPEILLLLAIGRHLAADANLERPVELAGSAFYKEAEAP